MKKEANSLEPRTPSIIDSSEWESQIPKSPEDMHNKKLEIVTSPGGRDGLRILVVKGRLTIETVASFQDAIRKEHAQELIVDMSGVPSMDSAGLGIMIAPYVHAKKTSRQVGFAGMNERVKAVTETSRLSQFLQIFATVKDAEAALSNSW